MVHSWAMDTTLRALVPRLRSARPGGCADRKPGDTGVRAALSARVTSLSRHHFSHTSGGGPGPGKGRAQRVLRSQRVRARREAAGRASFRCVLLNPRLELSRTWVWGGGSLLALLSSNSVPLLTSCKTWGRSPRFPVSEAVGLACAESGATSRRPSGGSAGRRVPRAERLSHPPRREGLFLAATQCLGPWPWPNPESWL